MEREIEFQSQGVTVRGILKTPDNVDGPMPLLVMAGGWCYVKEIVMPEYADFFVEAGVACLIFDYRCFGDSDGEPRQHADPWMQIEDYRAAIDYAETLPEVDADRIGIWGISYSGGHVLILGAIEPRIKCIVSNIPLIDGAETLRIGHGEARYRELQRTLLEYRSAKFKDPNTESKIPMSVPDPFTTMAHWPYPDVYEGFMKLKETVAPNHEHWSTIESTELCELYTVMPYVGRIVNIPTMMVIAEKDTLTMWDKETEAFNAILTPKKKLVVLGDITHMSLYGNVSKVEIASRETIPWLQQYLIGE
ncbi:MAG: alpha/beta hydrolase [Hyphomicrobiales bacterium]|nr:MAG: alpha/beta hydrolase [Hyphomicrobiales bacterium]